MSKTRIPVQSASAEYLRTMERRRIARRIKGMGEMLDRCDVTLPPHDGIELADEEVNALRCGIATGLTLALNLIENPIEESEEDDRLIATITMATGYAIYLDWLKESDG